MRENKGFSLVELIVVVGILAILGTGVIIATGANNGWRVNKCTQVLDSTLNKAMVQTMSKGNVSGMLLYKLDGSYYAAIISESCYDSGSGMYKLTEAKTVQTIALGHGNIDIALEYIGADGTAVPAVTLSDETNPEQMTSAAQLLFNRSTGEIKKVMVGGIDAYYQGITISSGSKSKHITIYAATGKHEIS